MATKAAHDLSNMPSVITLKAKAGPEGRLFGSVTTRDLAEVYTPTLEERTLAAALG